MLKRERSEEVFIMMTAMQQALVNSKIATQEQVSQVKIFTGPEHLRHLNEELNLLIEKIPKGDKVCPTTILAYQMFMAVGDTKTAMNCLINAAKRRLQELGIS